MSLATRCPSCGTVFRVVQDQLRVSEGWVRCGRCDGVFNAAEVLFDIDSGAPVQLRLNELVAGSESTPAPLPAPGAAPEPPAVATPPAPLPEPGSWPPSLPPSVPPTAPAAMPEQALPDAVPPGASLPAAEAVAPAAPAPEPGWGADPPTPAWALAESRLEPHFDPPPPALTSAAQAGAGPADFGPRDEPLLRAPSPVSDDAPPDAPVALFVPAAVAAAPAAAGSAPDDQPSFMRTAERAALWRRPMVRSALAAAVLLLALALALQLALVWRDSLAAHLPASEPALRALCRIGGCQLQPLRRIDALAVDSSGLNRLEGSSLYRLQVVLHNRAEIPVMMPALDLTLTDVQGRLVSRRVLQVAELGQPQALLQPGQELPIKVLLSTGDKRIDGYTLEVFYP